MVAGDRALKKVLTSITAAAARVYNGSSCTEGRSKSTCFLAAQMVKCCVYTDCLSSAPIFFSTGLPPHHLFPPPLQMMTLCCPGIDGIFIAGSATKIWYQSRQVYDWRDDLIFKKKKAPVAHIGHKSQVQQSTEVSLDRYKIRNRAIFIGRCSHL